MVDLGLDWGSVATGVAIGLIVGVVFRVHPWYVRRRERKAKEAEERSLARAYLRGGVQQVTRELRENARLVERLETGDADPSERRYLSLLQWRDFKRQIAGLQAEAPELWTDLVGMYADVDMARHGSAYPGRTTS